MAGTAMEGMVTAATTAGDATTAAIMAAAIMAASMLCPTGPVTATTGRLITDTPSMRGPIMPTLITGAIMAVRTILPDTFTEGRAFIDRGSTGRDFTDLEFTVAGGSIPVPGHSDPALSLDHTGPGPSAAGIGDGRVATASGSLITIEKASRLGR